MDSIARNSHSDNPHRRVADLDSEEGEEEDEFLMGETALLDEHGHIGSSSLSGLNQNDSDEDIELVMRPR